jgi:hypothetical protein
MPKPEEKPEKRYLGKLSDSSLQKVSDILGYDVSARDVIVTSDDVKHIFDRHGDGIKEVSKENLPLEQWAIDALPEIVTVPDSVEAGEIQKSGKHPGKRGVLISKSFENGKVVTLQFDNKGRGTMEITTMYVKSSGNPTQTLNVEQTSPQLTSETPSGPVDAATAGDTPSMLYGSTENPSALRPERMEPVSPESSVPQSGTAVKSADQDPQVPPLAQSPNGVGNALRKLRQEKAAPKLMTSRLPENRKSDHIPL